MSNSTEEWRGWVSTPNGRGTMDIIWSCVITVGLCCWTSLCLNAPARNDGRWQQLHDKVNLACLGLLGPELLFILALGQWGSARRSVQDFHSIDRQDWTIRHAFFADGGGFLLQLPDPDWKPFPIDAKQLHYLVTHDYVDYPEMREQDVGGIDGLSRFLP